jgi:hypothetical protein
MLGTTRARGRPPPGAPLLPAGGSLERIPSASADYVVEQLPAGLRLLAGAERALGALALGVGALLLRRLLLSIADGRPFDARNPRRIVIAACLLVGGVAASVAARVVSTAVLDHVGLGDGPLTRCSRRSSSPAWAARCSRWLSPRPSAAAGR